MKLRCGLPAILFFAVVACLLVPFPAPCEVNLELATYGPAPYFPDDGERMHFPTVLTWGEGDAGHLDVTIQLRDETTGVTRKTFTKSINTADYPEGRYQCDFLWNGRDDVNTRVGYGSYSVYYETTTATASGESVRAMNSGATAICGGAQVVPRQGVGDTRNNRGDPVNAVTGNLYMVETDLEFKGSGPFLGVRRHYNSYRVPLGVGWYNYDGWTFSFNEALRVDVSDKSVTYLPPDGTEWRFKANTDGTYSAVRPNCRLALTTDTGGDFIVTAPDGFTTRFNKFGGMNSQTDLNGNRVTYAWKDLASGGSPPIVSTKLYWFTEPRPTGKFRVTKITDSRGRWIELSYDAMGRVVAAADSVGRTVNYGYVEPPSKSLVLVQPSEGLKKTYVYGDKKHLDSIGVNDSPYSTIEYYPWPRGYMVKKQVFADGSTTEYAYLPDEGKTTITTNGRVGSVEYDRKGQITADVDPLGNRFRYTYTDTLRLATIRNPRGGVTTYAYDGSGNITSVTGPDGRTFTYEYDPRFAKVTRTVFPDGSESRTTYDERGNVVVETDPLGGVTTHVVNAAGLTTRSTYPSGDVLLRTYDASGFLATLRDGPSRTTTLTHNAAGWLLTLTDPGGGVETFTYDTFGRIKSVTDALGGVTTYEYDARYNLVKTTAPDGSATRSVYDVLDRRTATIDPTNRVVSTPYNLEGSIEKVVDQGGVEFPRTYDAANRLVMAGSPVGNLDRTYDASGNVRSLTNPADGGRSLTYAYDVADRNVRRYNGTERVDVAFDPLTSQITSVRDGSGTTTFTYDAGGRLLSKRVPGIGRVLFAYDEEGQIARVTPPGKKPIIHRYNAMRDMTGVDHDGTPVARYTYDVNHRPVKIALGNGVTGDITYDAEGNVTGVAYGSTAVPNIFTAVYTRDATGALTGETLSGSLFGDVVKSYGYDPAHRLVTSTVNGIVTQYAYDQNENRLLVKPGPAPPMNYTYDHTYRLTAAGGKTFTHDADANMASRTVGGVTTQFTSDARGRLKQVTFPDGASEIHTYNGLDERVKTVSSSTGTSLALWARGNILATCAETGSIDSLYVRGHDLVAVVNSGGIYYYLLDGLSNVVAVTDASGAVTQSYDYDPYGLFIETRYAGAIANPFTYGSQWYDESTGLYYLRNRYYDPSIGRFISIDPVGPVPEPNPYQYAMNNPLNMEDPKGLDADQMKRLSIFKLPLARGWTVEDAVKLSKGLYKISKFLVWKGFKYSIFTKIASGACGGASQERGQALANELPSEWKVGGYNWFSTNYTPHTFNIATFTASSGAQLNFYVDSYIGPTIFSVGSSVPLVFQNGAGADGNVFSGQN